MQCGETTFTKREVTKMLVDAGFEEGTDEFAQECTRCFQPVDGATNCFVEVDAIRQRIQVAPSAVVHAP